MLSNTLLTNQIKDAAGAEIEFERLSSSGRTAEFKMRNEPPAYSHRIHVGHQETGVAVAKRRRSLLRIDKEVASTVDATKKVTVSAYVVVDLPVGAMVTGAEFANVLAELMSAIASDGSSTTILYNGTGTFAEVLLNGGI